MRLRESLLEGLLDGHTTAATVAADIGADPRRPAGVVAFALADSLADRSALELRRAEITNLIAVHAAAYRRAALVTTLGARVYALLPDSGDGVLPLTREIVAAAHKHVGIAVRAAVGIAPDLSLTATARREADRVLDAGLDLPVASIADVRAEVVLSELLALLAEHTEIRDPRLNQLVAYDATHAGTLVPSVLAYLEALGDVRAAADRLHVHPNTLRYRVRRATEIAGIELDDPKQRLITQLQLMIQ
jgi:sugar diacid utilization regulator